ncbi:MAG: hypothetical protein IJ529_05225 [Alphaproteobacteria bacterium]|nr:hypothetical protein [Alphaproteobacteria bacterium]MBQ9235960.1 hypothetical protein [Alphaproteobacteria bacterium]
MNKILRFVLAGWVLCAILLPLCASAAETTAAQLKSMDALEYKKTYAKDQKATQAKSGFKNYICYHTKTQVFNDKGEDQERSFCMVKVENKDSQVVSSLGSGKDKTLLGLFKMRTSIGCPIVAVEWNRNIKCIFCSLLSIAYKASETITAKSFSTFAFSFAVLMVPIFVIWLAYKTLGYVSMFTTQDAAKYLTDITIQAFKFMISFIALLNAGEVFSLLIRPIFEAGINFANAFVDANYDFSDKVSATSIARVKNGQYYTLDIYKKLEIFSLNVNFQFSLLQVIGQTLRCLGGKFMTDFVLSGGFNFGLGICCLIYSLFFSVIGFLLSLAFVFYLFDAVVELGIFGAVTPFAIACWPFKMFTKATGTAIKLFMNSAFTFMMAGVAVRVCMELINNGFSSSNGQGLAGLIQAMDSIDVNSLKAQVGILSIDFLVFAFACLSGFLLIGKIPDLTDKFAGGGMSAVASKLATVAASSAVGTGKKLLKSVEDGVAASKGQKGDGAPQAGGGGSVGGGGGGNSGGGGGNSGGGGNTGDKETEVG